MTVCLCAVVLLTSCGGRTGSGRGGLLASQAALMSSVRVPILMYHHIGWRNLTAGKEWHVTTVTPMAFEQQMAYLANHGHQTIQIRDLV